VSEPVTLDAVRAAPNALAAHYSRFRVADRLLLTGHSHQAWPDVAVDGVLEAYADAAELVDGKWERAFAVADRLRAGLRGLLGDPTGEIALGANTHELLLRFLSAIDLPARPRLVTTDGEFHTVRRQLARLGEAGVDVVAVAAEPACSVAERLAAEVDDRTAAVLVSSVQFRTARIVPGLADLAAACAAGEVELFVDAYHALGVVPVGLVADGLTDAWVTGGGYKYLQLGEGNCFLRLPPHAADLRPVVTGWFAEFDRLSTRAEGEVGYPAGPARFAGSTYDPTSHYRAARVFGFFAEYGLDATLLRAISQHQTGVLAEAFDALDLPASLVTRDRDTPRTQFGGFLTLTSPAAERLRVALAERGVSTDSRGDSLRFGPAPYLCDDQLLAAMDALKQVATR